MTKRPGSSERSGPFYSDYNAARFQGDLYNALNQSPNHKTCSFDNLQILLF